ncbi:MAG: hypothetical protein ACK4GQ_02420 [Candidatus Hadarchaeales archaeon]
MTEITIDTIIELYNRELSSKEITDLPENFYQNAAKLIAYLRQELVKGEPIQKELAEKELKAASFFLRGIYAARVSKVLKDIAAGRIPAVLLEHERASFMEIRQSLEELASETLKPALSGAIDLSAPSTRTRTPAIFLTDLQEKIAGADAKFYGPFKKGDLVNLPEWNVNLLEKHGYLKRIKIKV